ncbi:MAG: glycine cleavage T C-terminal barrel domain-containing protein, partial [Planctomycetota bacterium]
PGPVQDPIVSPLAQDDDVDLAQLHDRPIVMNFAEPQAEYSALHKACGLMARGDLGIVQVTGRDALTFLNNLLTNALVGKESKQPMPVGTGCYSFFLNLKGRVVADASVLRIDDETVWLLTSRPLAATLAEALDRYRFTEKAAFSVISNDHYVLSLLGPDCHAILESGADVAPAFQTRPDDFPATSFNAVASMKLAGQSVTAVTDDSLGRPGVHLIVPINAAASIWDDLTTRFGQTLDDRQFGQRRLRPVGWGMFNAVRIEAGLPLLGVDFALAEPSKPGRAKAGDDTPEQKGGVLPAETGPLFDRAVSVVGGCYLGQEVVARMHARQVQAKNLVGLRMTEDALPGAGAPVERNDQQIGIVTSSTLSPILSMASIALATIKRPHFEVGTTVVVPAEGRRVSAEVVELPFVQT